MKSNRSPLAYSVAGALSSGEHRATCGIPALFIPSGAAEAQFGWEAQTRPSLRTTRVQAENLYWYSNATRQQTELWEKALFGVLGASGLVGVAVALL